MYTDFISSFISIRDDVIVAIYTVDTKMYIIYRTIVTVISSNIKEHIDSWVKLLLASFNDID